MAAYGAVKWVYNKFFTDHLFMGSFQIFAFIKKVMVNIHKSKYILGALPYDEFREIELLFQVYTVKKDFLYMQ